MKKIIFKNTVGFHKTVISGQKTLHIGDWMDCPEGDIDVLDMGNDIVVSCNGKGVGIFKDLWKVGEELAVMQKYMDAGYSEDHELFGVVSKGWSNIRCVIPEAMPVVMRITDRWVARLHDLTVEDIRDLGVNVSRNGTMEVRGDKGDIFFPENLGGLCDPKVGALKLLFDKGVANIRNAYDENPVVLLYRFEVRRRELC